MNWLDIAILITLSVFTVFGFMRGFIKEVFSLAAIFGGIIGGAMFYSLAGDLFIKYKLVSNSSIASVGGFIVITFGIYVIIQIIGWVLAKIVGTLHLSWIDRMAGGVLGAVKGVVIAFLLISAIGFFFSEKEPPFKGSILVPHVTRTFSVLKDTVPKDFREKLQRARTLIQEKGIKTAMKEAEKIKEVFGEEVIKKEEPKK